MTCPQDASPQTRASESIPTTGRVIPLHPVAHVLERLTRRHVKTRNACAVSLADLESRLTRRALVVWACYAAYRDRHLECWPSRATIAEMASGYLDGPVTSLDVRRALKRLREVGLVRDIRWVVLERRRKVYYRQVLGRVFLRDARWWVGVPMAVARELPKTGTRGGSRVGAGRPKGVGESKGPTSGIKTASPLGKTVRTAGNDDPVTGKSKGSTQARIDTISKGNQKVHDLMGSIPSSSTVDLRASLSEKLGPTAAEFSSEKKQEQVSQVTDPGDPVEVFEGMEFPPPYDGPIYAPGTHGIPERPCVSILNEMTPAGYRVQTRQPVTVPPARALRESDLGDEPTLLRRMRTALEGAVRGRGKKGSRWVRRMSARDKARALDLARALVDIPASPEAWFMFSAARWGSTNQGKMPVRYALSAKRFEKQCGWFRSEVGGYACRKVFRTKTEEEMCRLHGRVVYTLWELVPKSDDEIKAVVERYFPPGRWQAMVEQARREIDADQKVIDALVKRGEFVW